MTDEEPTVERDVIANAFDRSRDPLAEHEATFESLTVDSFDLFIDESLADRDITEETVRTYEIAFRHWKEYMDTEGRHPACPNEEHVAGFIDYLSEEHDNHPNTIHAKVRRLAEIFSFWQDSPEFPHPHDYDPVALVLNRVSFNVPEQKELPPITRGEVSAVLGSITHRRNRLIILLQLKLGLRATEVCNIRIEDLSLTDAVLEAHYPSLGDQWVLEGRPNAIYIPHNRDGNKSGQPRVLPLDSTVQRLLKRYLLSRPDVNDSWLFLSKMKHQQLQHQDITNIWKAAFHPVYTETKHHRAVTSHFGRHYFTTYWRVEQNLPRPLLQYMRGDSPGTESITDQAGIDHYIHTYYEDIEDRYRNEIFRLLDCSLSTPLME